MQSVRKIVGVVMVVLIGFAGGCNNAGQGAVTGAGVGAVTGLAIGSLSGNAGRGAAIGAIGGAAGGAIIGDQNRRQNEAAAAQVQAQRETTAAVKAANAANAKPEAPAPPTGNFSTGTPLGNLVGTWSVTGTIDDGDGTPLPIAGSSTATIDKNYFVRVDLRFTDPRANSPVEGTLIVSQLGGRTIRMTSFFSSSPVMREFQGDMDASGTFFNLRQFEPPGGTRRVMIRLSPGRQWTMDAWDGDHRTESLTFSWVGPA